MQIQQGTSFDSALNQFTLARCLNKKPKTIVLYRDVARLIRAAWPDPATPVQAITPEMVLEVGTAFQPQCVTRWNLMVAALRFITPEARLLKRRAVKLRQFVPPGQLEFQAFLAECDKRSARSHVGLVARFFCFTGMRRSEAYAIRWPMVDGSAIYIPASEAKNGLARHVPIMRDLPPVLTQLRALEVERRDSFVLPPESVRRALRTASQAAFGVEWSPHLCRHLFATRCITSGVDVPTAARWLGHKDGGALLARTYFHLADGHSQEMSRKVEF